MEIQCDVLYKSKQIRGFCHLYDGQEAIPEGMEAALTPEDPLIGAYRIHCQAYKRGYSVREIIAEMLGKGNGATKGKGGSMHYYKKSTNFYGGNGIVGAQIPVGTGLAFALKYKNKSNVASIMFGDGAANQGQLYEAANMAKLWNLPALFICENNKYGMGTSVARSSMNTEFYKRGDVIPGIKFEGNNVFEIREAFKWAKEYAINNGPLFIEINCYRYHGHSMSDPGISYRKREEVQDYRQTKDPILILQNLAVKHELATLEELEATEDDAIEEVKDAVKKAQADPEVNLSELTSHIYVDNDKHFIRGKLYEESIIPRGSKY